MDPRSDYRLLSYLFSEVLEQPENDRQAWLVARIEDPVLRDNVGALLAAHERAEQADHLETPPFRPADPFAGRRIGPWELVSHVGEGGMGVVYRARRADGAYERTVAVKLLRPGSDAGTRARRMVAESRIVAELDHPHIARLYDSGVTTEGLPYLAFEFVDGVTLDVYAKNRALSIKDRLTLFLQVCDAVAYAHRHLIVHRDLKPSNILVCDTEAGPHVRLVDFGIARLLDDEVQTVTQGAALTPAYAAPEQITGHPITTAADVYALGVLLYETLALRRPYELTGLTPSQIERTVCVDEPARPSAVAPAPLARQLQGDLDTIILKALRKDPSQRYRSADELGDDIQRHLRGFAVRARPATVAYRLRTFLRRRRAGVFTTASVLLFLSALSINYTVSLHQARTSAEASAERAEAISGFLERILRAPNARWYVDADAKGPDVSVRDVIDEAARRIDTEFADRPEIRADLHHILGDTYTALELYDEAHRHHAATLRLRRQLYPPPDPRLAEALYYMGMQEHTAADMLRDFNEAVAMLRKRPGGNNYPFLLQSLAAYTQWAGHSAEADSLFAEATAYAERHFTDGAETARYRNGLLIVINYLRVRTRLALGDFDGAETLITIADSLRGIASRDMDSFAVNAQCARGALDYYRDRLHTAEAGLRTCLDADMASRDPYFGVTLLVKLLDSQGRHAETDAYRPLGHKAAVFADSIAKAYNEARLTAR